MNHLYLSVMIFATCVALGFLVSSFKGQWVKKFIVMAALAVVGMSSYRAFNSFYGMPAILNDDIDGVLVIGHLPAKEDGVIYLWAIVKGDKYPKSFTLPYSKKTADALAEMSEANGGRPFPANLKAKLKAGGHLNPFGTINKEETVEEVEFEGYDFLPAKK